MWSRHSGPVHACSYLPPPYIKSPEDSLFPCGWVKFVPALPAVLPDHPWVLLYNLPKWPEEPKWFSWWWSSPLKENIRQLFIVELKLKLKDFFCCNKYLLSGGLQDFTELSGVDKICLGKQNHVPPPHVCIIFNTYLDVFRRRLCFKPREGVAALGILREVRLPC